MQNSFSIQFDDFKIPEGIVIDHPIIKTITLEKDEPLSFEVREDNTLNFLKKWKKANEITKLRMKDFIKVPRKLKKKMKKQGTWESFVNMNLVSVDIGFKE